MNLLVNYRWTMLLLGLMLGAASYHPWAEWLDTGLYYNLARLLPEKEFTDHTVTIAIDQSAVEKLGAWPWPPAQLNKLLHALSESQASAIGWALPLEKNTGKLPSLVLALPLYKGATHRSILHAPRPVPEDYLLQETPADDLAAWLRPLLGARRQAGAWQHRSPLPDHSEIIGAWPEQGQLMNAIPLAVPVDNGWLPSFPLALAATSLGVAQDTLKVVPGRGIQQADRAWYETDAALRVFPYPSRRKPTIYSATELLEGAIPEHVLKGKTLIVGATAPQLSEQRLVPGGLQLSVPLWTAQGVNALLNRSFVRAPWWSSGMQRGVLLLLTLYLLLLPKTLHGRGGLILGTVMAIALLNLSLLMLVLQNIWLPSALPVLLLVVGQLTLAWLRQRAQLIDHLQSETNQAYCELAENLSSQGQLDQAFDTLKKCSPEAFVAEALYQLGLDFERRRQFKKAVQVYAQIAKDRPRFRDIPGRCERLRADTQPPSLAATSINRASQTLIVDDSRVERPVLGRYRIERELGRGAMGTVYLGSDPRIGRTVAIKTLPLSEEFENEQLEEVRRRFYQEAETAGRLNHPNIVTIYDAGEEHDLAYLAMDYLDGENLGQHIHPDRLLPLKDVFTIGVQVAQALDYAHQNNVVHRDVKPGNIIYDSQLGQSKVMDFGIACLTDNSSTRTGTVLGSPYYMSPEQIAGKRVDGRADLFSLGVTLYQLMTGRLPFEGDSLTNLMYRIANEKPTAIRKVRKNLPACVTRLINKALEKDPPRRFASGNAMAEAIRSCAEKSGAGLRQT